MSAHGVSQDSEGSPLPLKTDTGAPERDEGLEELNGLGEVNLLEGLGSGKAACNIALRPSNADLITISYVCDHWTRSSVSAYDTSR